MKAATYAKALHRLSKAEKDQAKLAENLVAHLRARGGLKILPGILTELRAYEARLRKSGALVEAASEKEAHTALAEAKKFGIEAEKAIINPSLIRGWRARSGGTSVDRSGKSALIELYRNIVQS